MKLALDHHYAPAIAQGLRDLGYDVVAAVECGWQTLDDAELLDTCTAEGRALLTNNVADFAAIARRWTSEHRTHAGLIFTSDRSRPRHHGETGRFVTDLADLLARHDSFTDAVHWLRGPVR
ncbi:MAG: DUF5615 family PIN-like protein [Ilumatobacteraceae bacterium]